MTATNGSAAAGAPRLPDVLRDASLYEPPAEPQVVETHVSWIALAGPHAYKLKRPVRFEFLDYSTPDRRLAACRTELAVNRRWAPDLYLDLCWLVADGTGARFIRKPVSDPRTEGELSGEPAVRMRRFDREQELDRLIARADVTPRELRQLGTDLAGWHATSAAVPADALWGTPEVVLSAALDGLAVLRGPRSSVDAERIPALERRLREVHQELVPWLEHRRSTGRVRDCHGDLHCRNVVRIAGRLTPFDGIDFAAGLRWIDVASDTAFLAMDLLHSGRADLACAFLDGWLEASGDHDAARGLPWYLAYRALVRAKVAALRACQLGVSDGADAAWREAERFLALAEARLEPARGVLYATTGPSGSGKSRLAERLVSLLPAIRLRSDVERKRLAGLDPLERRTAAIGAGLYGAEETARTYERLALAAEEWLRAGFGVIVDAANLEQSQRCLFRRVAQSAGTSLAWLACSAAPDTLRARVASRSGDPSDATVEVLETQLTRSEPLTAQEIAAAIRVDTNQPFDAESVARRLRAAAAPPAGWTRASAPAS
jgi:uncharacterized protein